MKWINVFRHIEINLRLPQWTGDKDTHHMFVYKTIANPPNAAFQFPRLVAGTSAPARPVLETCALYLHPNFTVNIIYTHCSPYYHPLRCFYSFTTVYISQAEFLYNSSKDITNRKYCANRFKEENPHNR